MLTSDRPRAHGRRSRAALLIFALLSASPLGAQVPDGEPVIVNAPTFPWPIALYNRNQAAAVDRRGNAVFVWESWGPQGSPDGNGSAVLGRRFDRFGDPLGENFRINTYSTGNQSLPKVAFDGQGRFVVVWKSTSGFPANRTIFGQRFDSSGARIGAEFTVTQSFWSGSDAPSLAVAPSGAFVVGWDGYDGMSSGIMARRFDQDGSPLGSEFQVNTDTYSQQNDAAVAFTGPDGSFVVVYESPDGHDIGILAQAFSPSGDKVGTEFVVNAATTGRQLTPVIASVGKDGFAVVWTADHPWVPPGAGVNGRRFVFPDHPLGNDFRINESTTMYQVAPSVAADESGGFVVSYSSTPCLPQRPGCGGNVFARRYDAEGAPRRGEFQASTTWTGNNYPSTTAGDPYGSFIVSWAFIGNEFARWYGGLLPETVEVDPKPTGSSDGNGILEPGETVSVAPSWTNANSLPQTFNGIARTFTGPAGPTYELKDASAFYGTVAYRSTGSCADAGHCYWVTVTTPNRPAPHWDAVLHEEISRDVQGQSKHWPLHVGASFADVPRVDPSYRYVETALHAGVTSGCSKTSYCPDGAATREQMAVFVLVAKEGVGYRPPPCGTPMFADVLADSPFCPFVEELARRGVAGGCGDGLYCPGAAVTREQMAVLVVGAADSANTAPACVEGAEVFADVLASSPYCAVIEELARRNIVTGCGGGKYCPAARVTRAQMSVFLTVTFGLTLDRP